jgi:hypothetical protein
MKKSLLLLLIIIYWGCNQKVDQTEELKKKEQTIKKIEQKISDFHFAYERLCNGTKMNIDSLLTTFYEPSMRYITAWAVEEPYDSMNARLKRFIPQVSAYEAKITGIEVRLYQNGAIASYLLRQSYAINNYPLEELLPTVCVLEPYGENDWRVVFLQRTTNYATMMQYVEMQQMRDTISIKK